MTTPDRPYFASFDNDGRVWVMERRADGDTECIWNLVGHTDLTVAAALAEQMNDNLNTETPSPRYQAYPMQGGWHLYDRTLGQYVGPRFRTPAGAMRYADNLLALAGEPKEQPRP